MTRNKKNRDIPDDRSAAIPDERPPSRSQRKRDSLALQELGEELARRSQTVQDRLPLSEDLRKALTEYRRLSSREGKRRQMQYIGRLMREQEAPEAIAEALATLRLTGTLPG